MSTLPAMALVIRELHRAPKPELLNEEWVLVENTGTEPLQAKGWSVAVTVKNGKARPTALGTLDPGFLLRPGEQIRLVTGTASKKAQGTPPPQDGGVRNYHLFLREAILERPGTTILLQLRQLELARATFDPATPQGLA